MSYELKNKLIVDKWIMGINESKCPVEIGYDEYKFKDKLHYHRLVHECYIVISGIINIAIENKIVRLVSGDVLYVYPNIEHCIIDSTENAKIYIIKYPRIPNDKVIVE